jgi:hypothetical protein
MLVNRERTPGVLAISFFFSWVSLAMGGEVPFGPVAIIAQGPGGSSSIDAAAALAAADLDRDGNPDVIALFVTGSQSVLAWFENDGAPAASFAAHPLAVLPGTGTAIAAGDLDGDGDPDLVVATAHGGVLTWFENDGATTPAFTGHAIASPVEALALALGDVDHDGRLDLLAVTGGNVSWFENAGGFPPLFTPHAISSAAACPRAIAGADLDGDGDLDVLSAASCDGAIRWHENDGAATPAFTDHVIATNTPGARDVDAVDLDRDGDLDVVAAATDGSTIPWFENDGAAHPSFAPHTVAALAAGTTTVTILDLDADGDPDVIATARSGDSIRWYESDGAKPPSFAAHAIDAGGAVAALLACDVNRDGDPDLLARLELDQSLAWLDNRTLHGSAFHPFEHTIDAAVDEADEAGAFDIDGDGDLDVVAISRAGGFIAWWQDLDGRGGSWLKDTIDGSVPSASAAGAADIDGDGDVDTFGASFNLGDVYWWRNTNGTGSAWSRISVDSSLGGAQAVCAGDIDGDGHLDLVANGENADDVTWYRNADGLGNTWTEHTIDASFDGANFVRAADVDGDGDLDVLSAARNGDELAWWENLAGDGSTWTKHSIITGFDLAAGLDTGDLDGDGDLDVVGAAFLLNEISWWENADRHGTSWTKHLVNNDFTFAIWVSAADMDADGDLDLVGAAHNQGEISWFENQDGHGLQWFEHPVTIGFDIVTSSVPADLDRDGDLDILGAAAVEDAIKWWENAGGQLALATLSTAPPALTEGQTDDLLAITATHRGRAGDGDALLASLSFLLEQSPGVPLTSAQANTLFARVALYRDDGSGTFEPALDTQVASLGNLTLVNGVLRIGLASSAPLDSFRPPTTRVPFGAPATFFLVVQLTPDAADHGITTFQITHLPTAATALDLRIEYAPPTSTGSVTIVNQ